MKKVSRFHKVTFEQYMEDWNAAFGETDPDKLKTVYDAIKLPARATTGSAGYDFFAPCPFSLSPSESILIPTGIRVDIEDGWFMAIFPRSGLGFKYRLQLNNTVGIIDSDYFYSDNEGHILIKITNDSKEGRIVAIEAGKAFAQGIFMEFGITFDDEVSTLRNGGIGSTSK